MSQTVEDLNLTRSKLKNLIARARQYVEPAETNVEYKEYDWTEPHHYNPETLSVLEVFSAKIVYHIFKALETLCQGEFDVQMSEVTQHYTDALVEKCSVDNLGYYYLSFYTKDDKKDCGFIGFSTETALTFVKHMLRDNNEDYTSDKKELSALEETILMDVISAIIDGLATVLGQAGYKIVKHNNFVRSEWPVEVYDLEDLTQMQVSVSHPEGSLEFFIVLLSKIIDPALGVVEKKKKVTPQQISNLIMKQVYKVPVKVEAQLMDATMRLADLVEMKKDDIIMLKKRIHEPVNVLLNGSPCMKGYPAVLHNKYAVVITETDED
jgi:flagellar motor switch protein FliM